MLSQPGFVSASPTWLDIEFEPTRHWTSSFFTACSYHGSSRRLATAARRVRLTLPERKLLQLRVIHLCARFGISQDRMWNSDETAVRLVPKKPSQPMSSPRAPSPRSLAANMRGGVWTQIVYEEKIDRVHPHGPLFPRQLVSHSPTHWITQEALLDMIDAIDADMHARPGDAEQRNFTAYTQPLDRAHMRAFKSSIRSEVAKHFAEFFLEVESNFEHVNLDSSTSVLRQLLLSFAHTAAAQDADSQQHRTAGWRFIDWNEVEQRELLAEAKRLLETGELFPRGTGEEPHAPEAHVLEPLADDHDSDDAPTGVEESAAPAVAAAPKRSHESA